MAINPIIRAVAELAAATDFPLSGITLSAPMVSGAPILSISWAYFGESDAVEAPAGVQASCLAREDDAVMTLPAFTDINRLAIEAAWLQGAWDVKRTAIPAGHAGALPPYAARDAKAYRAQGWVAWYWRPMLGCPDIRRRQARPDVTLDQLTGTRQLPLPELSVPALRPGEQVTVRLGRTAQEPRHGRPARPRTGKGAPRRATVNQLRFVAHLRRRLGEPAMPAGEWLGLTFVAAAEEIDRLKARLT